MQKLIAKRRFNYAGKRLKPGDVFCPEEKHANLLIAVGNAEWHIEMEAPPKRTYKRRDLSADKPPEEKPKRNYRRRDMKAEK